MALIEGNLTLQSQQLWVVYSEDPSVECPPELEGCGWVPAERCRIKSGATKVFIRSLSPNEWARYRDEHRLGEGTAMLYATTTGTLRVGESKRKSDATMLVHLLSVATKDAGRPGLEFAHDLLGMRIIGLTRMVPVANTYKYARLLLGYEDPEQVPSSAEPADDETPSKPTGTPSPIDGVDGFELEDEDDEEGPGTSGRRKSQGPL